MKLIAVCLMALCCGGCLPPESGYAGGDHFHDDMIGQSPRGFSTDLTGQGAPGVWVIREDPEKGKVLAQVSNDSTSYRFPLCIYDGYEGADVSVSVDFKPVAGQKDQAAGIVWRYRDKSSYYVARANALEQNVVVYKVQDGKRSDLKVKGKTSGYGISANVIKEKWNSLRIVAKGTSCKVYLNEQEFFEVNDDTFMQAGKVGLWTKADSVIYFRRLNIWRMLQGENFLRL